MLKKTSILLAGVLLAWAAAATAADKSKGIEVIRAALPALKADEVQKTPVDGWYEIMLGSQIAYVSADAKYLMRGDLIELGTDFNYTESRRNQARKTLLSSVPEESAITFSPENVKHSITVFTDIDCGYCRKLHSEIAQLEGLGIAVKYMFFPRAGPGSPSWTKAASVWCADDRNEALTNAKAGQPVQPKECEAPIAAQYKLGRDLGLRGTPFIITESGEMISGYLPADRLIKELEKSDKTARLASARK